MLLKQQVDISEIQKEWATLKAGLYRGTGWEKRIQTATWPQVNREFKNQCPNFLSLIDLILSLPDSTAECERGFSALKATKRDWRSRLKADTLSDLLTVQLHSPDVEDFNPKDALELWAAPTPRRASFMRSSTVSKEEIVGDSDSEEEEEDEKEEVESEVEESEKMDEPTTSATPDEFFFW